MNIETIRFVWDTIKEEEIQALSTPKFLYIKQETVEWGANEEMRKFLFQVNENLEFYFYIGITISESSIVIKVEVEPFYNGRYAFLLEDAFVKESIKKIEPIFMVLDEKAHFIKKMLETDPRTRLFSAFGKPIHVSQKTKTKLSIAKLS